MKKILLLISIAFFICTSIFANQSSKYLNHKLNVKIDINLSKIYVVDTIYFPNQITTIEFYLNPNLSIKSSGSSVAELDTLTFGNKRYEVVCPSDMKYVILEYEGNISNNKELFKKSEKGKRVGTTGLIYDGGVYLSGSTYWVPVFDDFDLFTFELNVNLPTGFKVVSQGDLIADTDDENERIVKYSSTKPGIQVYLIANKWTEYSRRIGGKDIRVFLINPDEALAQRYLGVTAKYMMMYNKLIGDYPYNKFDVVENFWETGFGMPSFTLLGQKVIRFPWILASSYPHEYLHNYWGNSVFVDNKNGNWSEGITTYMADFLLKEQKGEGVAYRRNALKKYADYVSVENDYPVSKFKTRKDEASDAIGYSKVLMINHMLRMKYGAERFIKAYTDFFAQNKFKNASFTDIQKSFENTTGNDLKDFFAQWVNGVGAPSILLNDVTVNKKRKKYNLSVELEQKGTEKPFSVEIPVFVYLEDNNVVRKTIKLSDKKQTAKFVFDAKPLRVDIDPHFDVMRKLAKEEVPVTLSGIFGSKEWVVILPKQSPFYNEYKMLADGWKKMYARRGKNVEVIDDDKVSDLPANKSVWVLGKENSHNAQLSIDKVYRGTVGAGLVNQISEINNNGVVVYTIPNPKNVERSIVYFNSSKAENISKITRKLMHYGSYSYLGFDGNSMKNTLKGVFPVVESPLSKILVDDKIDWGNFSFPKTDLLSQ